MSKVNLVRLDSGEELLCSVGQEEYHYVLTDVAIIIPQQDGQIGLMHFCPYSKIVEGQPLQVPVGKVLFISEPVDGLAKQYKKMFGAPDLVLPTEGIITQ